MSRLRTVIPAPGWMAEFHDRVTTHEATRLLTRREPLVGWAVIEDDYGRRVVGMISSPPGEVDRGEPQPDWIREVVESDGSFAGYVRDGEATGVRLTFPVDEGPVPEPTRPSTDTRCRVCAHE